MTRWYVAFAVAILAAVLVCVGLADCAAPAQSQAVRVYKLWPKAALVDAAAIHASRYRHDRRQYLRYFDLAGLAPDERTLHLRLSGFVSNSLSRKDLIVLPRAVPGTEKALAFIDLYDYGIDPVAFDRLGELGSGPVPRAEPYYHARAACARDSEESYTVRVPKVDAHGRQYVRWDARQGRYVPEYTQQTRTRKLAGKKASVALGPHLNLATAIGLAKLTHSEFPIYEYRWLVYNALVEPRYHEILGLDDTEASVQKLALVDEKQAEKIGSQLRGAVIFSEVAEHNRILDRYPTPRRHGKGSYWVSLDFAASVNLTDVLKDVLIKKGFAAKEIIFTLANGLQGYSVVDGKGKRQDKADPEVAQSKRHRFRKSTVYQAYVCMDCHLAESGWIDIDDDVRAFAKKSITLYADAFGVKDKTRGEQIRQKYLADDINELIRDDRLVVERAVRTATAGLTSAQTAKALGDLIAGYLQDPVSVEQLARELGYSQREVLAAMSTPGVDPVFVRMRAGMKGRRDQVEAGFVQLAAILYLGKHKHGGD